MIRLIWYDYTVFEKSSIFKYIIQEQNKFVNSIKSDDGIFFCILQKDSASHHDFSHSPVNIKSIKVGKSPDLLRFNVDCIRQIFISVTLNKISMDLFLFFPKELIVSFAD